ncbi:hypothetical protein CRG98_003893 [Punica granatum]|uniref:Uncharacterized protein n=1 Tax=Punica granatum TaxID=22663 RepID=A0A2I0L556_PUNGR|nr:hypothetical protein CRG98_003893 [Punica granatum]
MGRSSGATRATNLENSTRLLLVVGPLGECLELLGARLEPDRLEERAELELGEAAVSVLVEGA